MVCKLHKCLYLLEIQTKDTDTHRYTNSCEDFDLNKDTDHTDDEGSAERSLL